MKKEKKKEIIPYQNAIELSNFIQKPAIKIAEAITGAMAEGSSGMAMVGARIVQGALKGNFFKQFAKELNHLIDKGKISEDYVNKKFGFKTFSELLKFIDEEDVDEDRLFAVKAMFYAINKKSKDESLDGGEILNYYLFKLSKELSASQILLLKVIHDFYKDNKKCSGHAEWVLMMASVIGHNIVTVIKQDEEVLMSNGLISERRHADQSGIDGTNNRLTDLGLAFCRNLDSYQEELL